MKMNKAKMFRVVGKIMKPNFQTPFQKEIRAMKSEEAIEEIYKILGSKHRVKRFYIEIETIEEVPEEESGIV